MNGSLALLMAVAGGFFGTSVALTGGYLIVRAIIVKAFKEWLGDAHERSECPVCKRPMKHEAST